MHRPAQNFCASSEGSADLLIASAPTLGSDAHLGEQVLRERSFTVLAAAS